MQFEVKVSAELNRQRIRKDQLKAAGACLMPLLIFSLDIVKRPPAFGGRVVQQGCWLFLYLLACVSFILLPFISQSGATCRLQGAALLPINNNHPIDRALLQEGTAYTLDLQARQYAQLEVESPSGSLLVSIYGPSGQKVREMTLPGYLPMPVSLIAQVPGAYRVLVKALDPQSPPIEWRLQVINLRPSEPNDITRIAAETAFGEGEKLRKRFQLIFLRKAIQKFEQAYSSWRITNDLREQAYTLTLIGDLYHALGNGQKAFLSYDRALTIGHELKDQRLEADALSKCGYVQFYYFGNAPKALEQLNRALFLNGSMNPYGEARILNALGELYLASSDHKKALDCHERALAITRAIQDREGEAYSLLNIGTVYSALFNSKKGIDYFRQAITLWQRLGDPKGEAIATIGAAHLHSKVGEKQEAIDGYSRALKQVRLIGDIVWEASIYSGLRYVYSEIGDLNKALQTNIKALMLFQRARVPQGVLPSMMITGQLYHQLKALQKALTYLNQARRLSRLTKVVNLEPALLREIGSILDELGQADEALKYYNEATTLSRAAGDGHLRELASSLRSLADWYFRHDSNEKALGYLNEALAIARKADHKSEELATLYLMAQVERDLSHPSQAMLRIEEALRLFELLRSELKGPELRTTYVATVQKIYDLYIDLLMREHRQNPSLGFAARALEINERARARTLVESLLESRADIRENVDADLLKRETELLQRIIEKARYRDQLLMKPYGPAQVKLVEAELREMDAELQLVRSSIRAANPRYAAQTASQSLGASEIQALLDPETLLLEYRLGDERSYVWAVSQTSVTSYELPARRVIEDEVLGFYQALTEGADSARGIPTPKQHLQTKGKDIDYRKSAARLSQMLLSPVAAQLRAKRLVIVADGALQYINFAALSLAGSGLEHQESAKENSHRPLRQDAVTPEAKPPAASTSLDYQPLMLNHEIINLPSAAVLAVLRQQFGNRPPASKSVAVIADPVFDKNDERLKLIGKSPNRLPPPTIGDDQGQRGFNELLARTQSGGIDRLMFSYQEAEAILQATRGAPTLQALGFEASREKILHTDLSAYRFIHFATHGFINNENPDLSGIVLSLYDEHGNQQNGYLRLSEICNLRLNADLVVLSACQTALGKEFRGEGLMGLTRGFMQAGALRVIASLWNVNDKATAELMKLFYNKLLIEKMPPAQALRAAQIELFKSRRWQSPYYWAGFVIQGEWN